MIDNLHTQLETNGFVIIDVLENDSIIYLNQLCDKYLQINHTDFISSSHILDKVDSDFINQELHKLVHLKFEKLFPELQLLGGTLATKIKGKSNVEAHQDWTIVDEQKYNSYNLWIPLVDTNKNNGTLGIIPGSHLWNHPLRGLNIPNIFEKYTNLFLRIGYEPELCKGNAILYNHKLIHYSRANKSTEPRNVAIIGAKDKNADLIVSFCADKSNVETYKVIEEDFYAFNYELIRNTRQKIYTLEINSIKNSLVKLERELLFERLFGYMFSNTLSRLGIKKNYLV